MGDGGVRQGQALDDVAADLDVGVADIREMQRRTSARDLSIDQPVGHTDEGDGVLLADSLASTWADPEATAEEDDTRARFRQALTEIQPTLNEREAYILENRLLSEEPVLLDDIGQRFGVSKERARQLEVALLKKLRTRLGEFGLEAA